MWSIFPTLFNPYAIVWWLPSYGPSGKRFCWDHGEGAEVLNFPGSLVLAISSSHSNYFVIRSLQSSTHFLWITEWFIRLTKLRKWKDYEVSHTIDFFGQSSDYMSCHCRFKNSSFFL